MRNRNLIRRPKAQGGETPLRFSLFFGDTRLLSCFCVCGSGGPLFEGSL